MNKADFRIIHPTCMICDEVITDDECYILEGPGPSFDNCIHKSCIKKEMKIMKRNNSEVIYNDYHEYIIEKLKTTPVNIEEDF